MHMCAHTHARSTNRTTTYLVTRCVHTQIKQLGFSIRAHKTYPIPVMLELEDALRSADGAVEGPPPAAKVDEATFVPDIDMEDL